MNKLLLFEKHLQVGILRNLVLSWEYQKMSKKNHSNDNDL